MTECGGSYSRNLWFKATISHGNYKRCGLRQSQPRSMRRSGRMISPCPSLLTCTLTRALDNVGDGRIWLKSWMLVGSGRRYRSGVSGIKIGRQFALSAE